MSHFNFADTWLVYILGPVVLIWALGMLWRFGSAQQAGRGHAALRFSSISSLKRLKPSMSIRIRQLLHLLRILTVVLITIAILRPQTGMQHTKVLTEGIDIILAIDTSGSMQALDLDAEKPLKKRRNRLEVVKSVVAKFVEKRPNDQIGVVVFGEEAFTQCPLTLDHGIVATFLDGLEIGMAGDSTAIGSALGTAVRRLKDSQAKSKIVVLLTDGRSNAGSLLPQSAAEAAAAFGIKVYTIGAGTRGKAPFLQQGLFGSQPVYQDVEIDETTLQAIATTTQGAYFRAEDETALDAIYGKIDALEKTEIKSMSYLEYNEEFSLFVWAALLLLLTEIALLGTRYRKIP
jgi:Ca-activated chloride channel family protein